MFRVYLILSYGLAVAFALFFSIARAQISKQTALSNQYSYDLPLQIDQQSHQICKLYHLKISLSGLSPAEVSLRLLEWLYSNFPSSLYPGVDWRAAEKRTSPGGTHYTFDQLYEGWSIPEHGVKFTVNQKGILVFAIAKVLNPKVKYSTVEGSLLLRPSISIETLKSKTLADLGGYLIETEVAWWLEDESNLKLAYRFVTLEDQAGGSHEIWYDYQTGKRLAIKPRWCNHKAEQKNGYGRVFRPDPLTTGGVFYRRGTLHADNNNSNNSFFDQQYIDIELKDLLVNPSGYQLIGPYVRIEDIAPPSYPNVLSSDGRFVFDRSHYGFEQVSAYYHIDSFQRYIQSLGFDDLGYRPLRVDAHGFRDDNSAFFPGGNQSYILMGEGGVDDAEDADVLIHEYLHSLSDYASPRTRNGTERRGLDEGFGDYFAASWSRSFGEFRWHDIFTWDGHNEFWPGRSAAFDRLTYPEMKSLSWQADYIYLLGQLWATALMKIWDWAGRTVADRIVLQTLYLTYNNMTLTQSAHATILADSLLYNGRHTALLQRAFCEARIIEGPTCEALSISPRYDAPSFRIYPNPTTDELTISYETILGSTPIKIQIVDLTGRVKYETFLYGKRMRIDTAHLPLGVYVVKVYQNGLQLWAEKIIVNN